MKKKFFFLFVLLNLLVYPTLVFAAASDTPQTEIADDFLPSDSPITINNPNQVLYEKYDITRYYLDAHYSTWAIVANVQNSIQNAYFQLLAVGVKTCIYVLQYAYTLDVVKELSSVLDTTITALKNTVWEPFLPSAMTLLGLWGIYRGFVKREMTSAASDLVKHFIILVTAIYMFTNTSVHLSAINDGSQEISADLLAAAAQVDPYLTDKTSNGALIQMGNTIWRNFIHNPWELMMFGELNSGHADDFLSKVPLSDEREDLYDEDNPDFDMMEEAGLPQRYLAIFLISLTGFIYLTFMFILSGAVILSQIMAIFIAVIAPIVFIMSLWPGWGTVLVQRWFRRLFGALFVKVGLSLVLSVLLVLSSVLYQKYSTYGIVIISFMQLLLVIGIILERNRLTRLVTDTITKGSQAAANIIDRGSERFQEVGQHVRQTAVAGVGLAAAAYTGNPNLLAAGTRGAILGAVQYHSRQRENTELEPIARASLENQYALELAQSLETGRETELVKRTNSRLSQGLPMFTNKEVAAEIERLKDIRDSGGDIRKVLLNPNFAQQSGDQYISNQERFRSEMEQIREKLNVKQSEMSDMADRVINTPVRVERKQSPDVVVERPANLGDQVIYQPGPPPVKQISGPTSHPTSGSANVSEAAPVTKEVVKEVKVDSQPVRPPDLQRPETVVKVQEAPKVKVEQTEAPKLRVEQVKAESPKVQPKRPEVPKRRGPKK